MAREHLQLSALFADHAAGRVLAAENASILIVGVAIGHIAGIAIHGHTHLFTPAIQTVCRNVAEGHVTLLRMPDGALGELELLG